MEQPYVLSLKDVEQPINTEAGDNLSLKSINLNVAKGQILGVIGRQGCGKSTLLRCMALLQKPLHGIVALEQQNLTIMNSKDFKFSKAQLSYLPSVPYFLTTKTVYQNIALPLHITKTPKNIQSEIVESLLDICGLVEKQSYYPHQLTAGQKQLTAIARALVTEPRILLCDDITSGLDYKSIQQVTKVLRQIHLNNQTTMVFASNDVEIIKNLCNEVILMQHGSIVEHTDVFTLFEKPKSEVASNFVKAAAIHELPFVYRRQLKSSLQKGSHPIVRFSFSTVLTPEIVLTSCINEHDIRVSILQAYQEDIQQQKLQIMTTEITGLAVNIEASLEYLTSQGLHSEILGYVPNID